MGTEQTQEDSWNRYWEHGFLTPCGNAFSGNYDGVIKDLWVAFFSGLSRGDRVLDICTGNGAIAIIANEVSRRLQLDLEIHGIDSAAIRPRETVAGDTALLEGIEFHGRTSAESTGFDDGCFQAISGQYALEYTDVDACIHEMARITAPGARLLFVIHHDRSVVMETSREEIRHVALLFRETDFFGKAEALIRIVGAAESVEARRALGADPRAEAAREGLNEAAARVARAAETSEHPQILHMAMKDVAEAYKACTTAGLSQALGLLEDCRGRIKANAERLEDLMSAGRTEDQLEGIRETFAAAGFSVDPPSMVHHEQGPLMGWVLGARRC